MQIVSLITALVVSVVAEEGGLRGVEETPRVQETPMELNDTEGEIAAEKHDDATKVEEGLFDFATAPLQALTTPISQGATLLNDGVNAVLNMGTPISQGSTLLNDGMNAVLNMGAMPFNALNTAVNGLMDPSKVLNSFTEVFEPFMRPLMGNVRGADAEKRALHKHKGGGYYGGAVAYPMAIPYAIPTYTTYYPAVTGYGYPYF